MTNFGGFPYSFPLYFGAGGGEEAEVGDMFISDFDEELLFNLIKENPRSRTRTIRNYYTPQSDYPSTIKEEIGTKELSFSGFFDYSLVESKHIRERKLDYFLGTDNRLLIINMPRDYATYFVLKTVGDVDDASFRDIDTFSMDGSAVNQPLGQIRLAIDSRCTTDGAKKGDNTAMQNRAVRLDSLNEYILFNLTQGNIKLPVGNYELIARMKAEQADVIKMEVLNLDDTDEWANIYSAGAVKILCLKAFKEKLYAGTSGGKIYVSENGTDFSLAFDTGQAEVHCFEEFEDCLYAGTGNNGYIYKYDEAAWLLEYDSSETDVFCFKEFYSGLYAGTGTNGKVFRLKGTWEEYMDLAEASIFSLGSRYNNLYAGTGTNGRILRLLLNLGSSDAISATYDAPGGQISGLAWDGSRIWSCDYGVDKIYKHNATNPNIIDTEYAYLGGSKPVGLTWDGSNLWSCDMSTNPGKIYKHNMDATLSIAATYNAPSNYPSGLTWDGATIWSCDYITHKIYKHNMDATLSIAATYDAPGAIKGLAWDGEHIWCCDDAQNRICKHNKDITIDFSYPTPYAATNPRGLTWDGEHIWLCNAYINKIYKYRKIGIIHDAVDTNIYTLKSHSSALYAAGDAGNIYKASDTWQESWSTDYATGEAEVHGLFELAGKLYAGTGNNGKLFSGPPWAEFHDLDDNAIYSLELFSNKVFIGTGADGNIYTYRNGIIAGEHKALTDAYTLYKLPFSITSLDEGDTIQFKITKSGSVAAWANIDFLCFVATR